MAELISLGQPFGSTSRIIQQQAPAPNPLSAGIRQAGQSIGQAIGLRGQQQQGIEDQAKFSEALGILQQGEGSQEAMSQALGLLSSVKTPEFRGFVRQLSANLISQELDPQGQRFKEAQTGKLEAEAEKLRRPEVVSPTQVLAGKKVAAINKLEESAFWLNKGITNNDK